MKNILLIGIGGTGSSAVDIFFQKKKELGNQAGNKVTALVFDTDAGDLKKISAAKTVPMADNASVGTICDRLGPECLREWFPYEDKAVRAQEMIRGASQWRKKSYLAFLNLMNKPLARSTFISSLESMTEDPSAICEIYIIASVAGGTGSGSFIPIALYAKRYLRKNLGKDPIINAMIALPDIYADKQTAENKVKVYSNAYAILRELNAINLVARNYNAGVAEHKKAPIKLKIGNDKDPNVGVLFDASDKKYWTPEAAPFSQVFLLDKIPGLTSVEAHNMVLANSLYTILCTEMGSEFDSEFSNHELLRSQSNGSNAIYAGISNAQIRFPKESVLDYLAHKKTEEACDSEWLILHNAVENTIKEREQQAKDCKRRYTMKDYEYADIVVEETEKLVEGENSDFASIMERGVYSYDDEGKRVEGLAISRFMEEIDAFIASKIEDVEAYETDINSSAKRLAQKPKIDVNNIKALATQLNEKLKEYYIGCVENIKGTSGSTTDAIINIDKKKTDFVGKKYSAIEKLIKKDGSFIHPVAAMVQLCSLRKEITAKIEECRTEEWEDLRRRNVDELPDEFVMVCSPDKMAVEKQITDFVKGGKSAYLDMGEVRYKNIISNTFSKDKFKRSNTKSDVGYVWQDTLSILQDICDQAHNQLKFRVYTSVAQRLDILISKYRNFFNRFIKEKEELVEQTKTAYRKDAENYDSVVNVFSSCKDKDRIFKMIVEEGGPVTDAEILKTDAIIGFGVFKSVFDAASSEVSDSKAFNENDSKSYRDLFANMIDAYKESISKSEAYKIIDSYNVIEAMIEKCGENADDKSKSEYFKASFSVAQEIATPSLRITPADIQNDIVTPSNVMVFMMSYNTGKYLKKHAEELGLTLPADNTNEDRVIESCAEEFIHHYSGNNSARVSIVKNMPDNVLYCTGEIMDISPLRIAKFDELGEDNIYFKNYMIAIKNIKKYGTDMWNPHLGHDLYKRGYLPYMNEAKEKECDTMVVKALLYGFQRGLIMYEDGIGEANGKFYFTYNGNKILDPDKKWINAKKAAQLIAWLRNEDELVADWSERFDKDIARQMNELPTIVSDNATEIIALEGALTKTAFMRILTEKLYNDPSKKEKRVKLVGGKATPENKEGPTALEFAYMIKTSEELSRDCDDAERVLRVLYSIFKQLCEFRTTPETTPERFIQVYKQQLGNAYEALATVSAVMIAQGECKAHFNQLAAWLNDANVFKTISSDNPMDERGNVCIDTMFDFRRDTSTNSVLTILDFISKGKNASAEDNSAK